MPNDANRVVLTPEGKRKLEEELAELKGVKRKEIADEIRTARGFGDLSENAEYDEAKNAQARMETRVRQIEEMLRDCELIIERLAAVTHCDGCGQDYATVPHGRTCPHCGSGETWLLRGNEFNIKEIAVE